MDFGQVTGWPECMYKSKHLRLIELMYITTLQPGKGDYLVSEETEAS